ncbi:pyridoxamine 5'-phosphate oxidase family protein [Aromatoleum buckelii]|uniref:Pyridoxamine 5'-phosphate oxidase n=1 Tax=Aromatoleum buckelii TaxID=200254 RepID=A0ABX1N7T8_9RHOO|nr:pyridoxamine 5'-phosphate oxidase family protein [Aromatoleum buckelii]MCK0509739.1 pyridoxamine 5'-phosphate oxidase family protein [Aromatoleum buckelii]
MANAFMEIAFTPNVRALQARMGSRDAYARGDEDVVKEPVLGPYEIPFIEARDSFYLGTVSETGWPYVQHRGGPTGFLKVLDSRTIGFADFSGNRQYVSTGNLAGDNRVSLFLMDYPRQTRLKILGRARVVDEDSESELMARLDNPHYRARVERGIVIRIEGFDWNCPKYITPRYTEEEVAQRIRDAVEAHAGTVSQGSPGSDEPLGSGELALAVTGVRQLTLRVRAYELRAEGAGLLPPAEAGSHLEVPVRLADGSVVTRQYSLAADPASCDAYEIAVLRESEGRGGSLAIHETWQIGTRLRVSRPINHFPLHADSRPAVLIAGGIGITAIKAMAEALRRRNSRFELHYTGRTPADMAYHRQLARELPASYFTYSSRVPGEERLDVSKVLPGPCADAVFYVCGPAALIEAVRSEARRLGIAPERVQSESFT